MWPKLTRKVCFRDCRVIQPTPKLRGCKQSVCLQCGRPGFDPWVGKIPWRRKWQPTPVLLPGKSHGQRSLVGCSPWGLEESDMTERLHFHFQAKKHNCRHLHYSAEVSWLIPPSASGNCVLVRRHKMQHTTGAGGTPRGQVAQLTGGAAASHGAAGGAGAGLLVPWWMGVTYDREVGIFRTPTPTSWHRKSPICDPVPDIQ